MPDASSSTSYQAPAVRKAFQLLRAVAESKKDLSLSELAQNLEFSKSTTHGLVQALLKIGALDLCPHRKKFYLGPTIVELAFRSWNYFSVCERAQPSLDVLRDRIGETVFLGVLSRSRGIIIATSDAAKPLKISSPPGTSIPLLSGAVGKVFLAQLDDRQAVKLIREYGLPHFTAKSIIKESDYLKELQKVRELGYAFDDEEYLPGVKAVAVSLGNHRGLPLAIWVVGFVGSMTEEVMPEVVQHTVKTAQKLQSVIDESG